MASKNEILTKHARSSLADKWPLAVGSYFVASIIISVASAIKNGGGGIITMVVSGPMRLGQSIFSLNIATGKKAEFSQIFDGFKDFGEALLAQLLVTIFVMLWSLLLIVPGIIAAIAYSQTFYIMADHKNIKGYDALRTSKDMMVGYKWKYFLLGLRFFGWCLLSVLTFGIGFLWLVPYMNVSYANFYLDINKAKN